MQQNLTFGPLESMVAVTAATAGKIALVKGQSARITVVIQGTGTISGGAMVLEEAYFVPTDGSPYSGSWSQLPVNSTPDYSIDLTTLSGGEQMVIHYDASMWAVRPRNTDAVTGGGSVSVTIWGN